MTGRDAAETGTGTGVDAGTRRAGFWVGVILGWAIIGFGVLQLVLAGGFGRIVDVGIWVVALDLVHDLAFAPAALLVALVVTLVMPSPGRGPVLAGLGATVVVLLLAWPLLAGYGRLAGNPSVLPLDYPTAVAWVLGVVWGLVVVWLLVLLLRHRRTPATRDTVDVSEAD